MLTGSCAFAASRDLNRLFGSLVTAAGLREVFGDLDEATAQDLALLITSGTGAIVNDWVVDAHDPLDPEELADRLLLLLTVFASSVGGPDSRDSVVVRDRGLP
jgi:hypothetical protein